MATPTVAKLALPIVKRLKKRDEEWREERSRGWVNYCRHGRFIGDPYGADYMCGACEAGYSVYEEALAEAMQLKLRADAALRALHTLREVRFIDSDEAWNIGARVYEALYAA